MSENVIVLTYEEAHPANLGANVLLAYLRAEKDEGKSPASEREEALFGEGWCPLPAGKLERDLGLSSVRQSKLLGALKLSGKVEVVRKGLPPKRYFRLAERNGKSITQAEEAEEAPQPPSVRKKRKEKKA